MKQIMRTVALFLLFSTLLSAVAFAADSASPCSSAYLQNYTTQLALVSGSTKLNISFHVSGTKVLDEIGAKQINLQRSTDGESWTTMKIFWPSDYPRMLGTNTISHGSYVEYSVSRGFYYRAYIKIWGGKDGGGDSRYVYTNVIDLKNGTGNS